jgi:hypothetical protein
LPGISSPFNNPSSFGTTKAKPPLDPRNLLRIGCLEENVDHGVKAPSPLIRGHDGPLDELCQCVPYPILAVPRRVVIYDLNTGQSQLEAGLVLSLHRCNVDLRHKFGARCRICGRPGLESEKASCSDDMDDPVRVVGILEQECGVSIDVGVDGVSFPYNDTEICRHVNKSGVTPGIDFAEVGLIEAWRPIKCGPLCLVLSDGSHCTDVEEKRFSFLRFWQG